MKILYSLGIAMVLAGILFTFARGSWIALIVVFITMLSAPRKQYNASAILMFVFILIFLLYILIPQSASFGRIHPLYLKSDFSYFHRILMYKVALQELKLNPLIGVGMQNLPVFYPYFKDCRDIFFPVMDNQFFCLLVETGIIGFLLFIFLLFRIFKFLLKNYNKGDKKLVWALFTSITGFLVNSFTFESLYWTSTSVIFWTIVGLSISYGRITESCKE